MQLIADAQPEEGTVVWADRQTAGRGRFDRQWHSQAGKNLTFSLILKPHSLPAEHQFYLSKVTALGLHDALHNLIKSLKIKWPNDISADQQKLAGILIEHQLLGIKLNYSVIGVGLNVNQIHFGAEAGKAISLKQLSDRSFRRKPLLLEVCHAILARYHQLLKGDTQGIDRAYQARLWRYGRVAEFKTASDVFMARIVGVDVYGHLRLLHSNGQQKNYSMDELQMLVL